MKKNIISISGIFLLLVVLVLIGGASKKEASGRFIWNTLHTPHLALLVYENDALSFDIGNYYFNATGSGVYNQEKAKKYFEKTIALNPGHEFARHQLARIYFLRGNFEEALGVINTQIEKNGTVVPSSYYVRGLIYGFSGSLDSAEKDFLHFISIKDKNWGGYNDVAWIYFQKGEYEQARLYAEKGLQLAPESSWLLTTYGVALMNLGEYEDAVANLKKARSIADALEPGAWSQANPGNDPRIAEEGLSKMKEIIKENLMIAEGKLQ
ncbi:MAG: tetratricopeptide repeat protein [Candidatus Paceibacterota bacterium]